MESEEEWLGVSWEEWWEESDGSSSEEGWSGSGGSGLSGFAGGGAGGSAGGAGAGLFHRPIALKKRWDISWRVPSSRITCGGSLGPPTSDVLFFRR